MKRTRETQARTTHPGLRGQEDRLGKGGLEINGALFTMKSIRKLDLRGTKWSWPECLGWHGPMCQMPDGVARDPFQSACAVVSDSVEAQSRFGQCTFCFSVLCWTGKRGQAVGPGTWQEIAINLRHL